MKTYTVAEVAEITGNSEVLIRQHVSRGRLHVLKDGQRTLITQDDLDAYMSAEELVATVPKVRAPKADVPREIGNMIGRLPKAVGDAILEGMPTSKKPGSSDAYLKIRAGLPTQEAPEATDDPHWGYPVGYQHQTAPRWKRINESTWKLEGATWSWNGFIWEGGGSRRDSELVEGISPASPYADQRPLAMSKRVDK